MTGQTIPSSLGLFRFDLGVNSITTNEIFVTRTTGANIFTEDPANPRITNDPSLLTVLSGTVTIYNATDVTDTNFFLDVNTIAAWTSAPEPIPGPNPFALTRVLLAAGLFGPARRKKAV